MITCAGSDWKFQPSIAGGRIPYHRKVSPRRAMCLLFLRGMVLVPLEAGGGSGVFLAI
jgi:hypothetical protein